MTNGVPKDVPDLMSIHIADAVVCEKALLGGVMLDPQILPEVSAKLDPADFFHTDHKKIYKAMLEIHAFGIDLGFVEVYEYVRDLPFPYFTDLYDAALPGNVEYLVRRIKDCARRRQAQKSMMTSIESLGSPGLDLEQQWEYLSADFMKLLGEDKGIVTAQEQVIDTMKRVDATDDAEFIKTGIRGIDATTGGAQRGESWIIAGRSSMGKSSLAQTLCLNMARAGETVAYVPVEGSRHALMCRLLAIYTGVGLQPIRTGKLHPTDYPKLAHAGGVIAALNLSIIDETNWTKIRAKIYMLKLKEPTLAAVFIDYLQLIEASKNFSTRDREREVAFLSADAKRTAKELNLVMVLLSQLNRDPDKRKDHRPILSDLRESGAIEQDADVVLFPYRPAYYGEKTDFATDAEVAIGKNRDGAVGTCDVKFDLDCVRFGERDG